MNNRELRKRELKIEAIDRVIALIERDLNADLADHWDHLTTEELEWFDEETRKIARQLAKRLDRLRDGSPHMRRVEAVTR
jgi:hypothetical protein